MRAEVEAASQDIPDLLDTNILTDMVNAQDIIETKEMLSGKLHSLLQNSRDLQMRNGTLGQCRVKLRWLQIDIQNAVPP